MNDRSNLKITIEQLLQTKREGSYWDFKESWYEDKAELLLDIICMANNQEDRTAFLIIGIKDQTMEVVGVENDPNRKKLSDLSQFVNGKPFAVYAPEIDLQTIYMDNHQIDVISIFSTTHTPYYLEKDYKDQAYGKKNNNKGKQVLHGRIYVRVNDRKAGVDQAAPYSCIEHLWRRRFGLDLTPKQKMLVLLEEYKKWDCDWGNRKYAYHEECPEYQLVRGERFEKGYHPASAFYINPIMSFSPLSVLYHNTIIYESEIWSLDNNSIYLPKPFEYRDDENSKIRYSYYLLDSIEGKLLTIFTKGTNDIASRDPIDSQLLVFRNEKEKKLFDQYLQKHLGDYTEEEVYKKYQHYIEADKQGGGGKKAYNAFCIAKIAMIYENWRNCCIKIEEE